MSKGDRERKTEIHRLPATNGEKTSVQCLVVVVVVNSAFYVFNYLIKARRWDNRKQQFYISFQFLVFRVPPLVALLNSAPLIGQMVFSNWSNMCPSSPL